MNYKRKIEIFFITNVVDDNNNNDINYDYDNDIKFNYINYDYIINDYVYNNYIYDD